MLEAFACSWVLKSPSRAAGLTLAKVFDTCRYPDMCRFADPNHAQGLHKIARLVLRTPQYQSPTHHKRLWTLALEPLKASPNLRKHHSEGWSAGAHVNPRRPEMFLHKYSQLCLPRNISLQIFPVKYAPKYVLANIPS